MTTFIIGLKRTALPSQREQRHLLRWATSSVL